MYHVMLDIETLSTGWNAAVTSIGAVKFDKEKIYDEFYVVIDPASLRNEKFDIDPVTVFWWLDQKKEAQERITKHAKVHLRDALVSFATWYGQEADIQIWSYGANFDLPIIRWAYKVMGVKCPYTHRQERCFRTVLARIPSNLTLPENPKEHDALADATWQAKVAQLIGV